MWREYIGKATISFLNFFKQMAVDRSIFRWRGSIVLGSFWYVCDSGTIKSCIMIGKNWFWAFKKIITQVCVKCDIMIIFWNAQKSNVSNPNATFHGTTVMGRSKAAQNNWNPPSKVNIEWATDMCLKKFGEQFRRIFFLGKGP